MGELFEDDTTTVLTYFSTWSTNYTMSNLPGPGRLIGNLHSRAGSALEKRLGRRARQEANEEYKGAVAMLQSSGWEIDAMFLSVDPKEHEKVCRVLLICAKSGDVNIQLKAFQTIVHYFVKYTSKVQSAFKSEFKRLNEISDVTTFSWKHAGTDYSINWRYWYKQASRCLSSQQCLFFEAAAEFDGTRSFSLELSHFEMLLVGCCSTSDMLLAVRFLDWHWNRSGIREYVRRKGLHDPALINLARALVVHWEIYSSQAIDSAPIQAQVHESLIFVKGVLECTTDEKTDPSDRLSEHSAPSVVWVAIFELYHFLRVHSARFEEWYGEDYIFLSRTWRAICEEYFPNPAHVELRQKVLCLQDIYGPAMRRRHPPRR
ncbi:hypothetical protein SCHPADRAFT_910953 [Schizopora paradoxa]|uniref:Uncharacterized protein n=1 Tax=Schizopora paradoxa TaxID=27342 RepID=A0A0H2R1F7_9AGAM|nr:hypothetical protein SCHPADRAFT_910953 [Schizopora paradoxa]